MGGKVIMIKKCKTSLQKARNYALIKTHEMLSAHSDNQDKAVELVWPQRQVTVDKAVAFKQNKEEQGGSFAPPVDSMSLS